MSDDTFLLDLADPRPVHFMGAAGAGMNALAELLIRRGVTVSGCDSAPDGCENLRALGVEIAHGHDAEHVAGVRAIVVSSAISREHPEIIAARHLGIPVVRRAEALAQGVSGGRLIAIAGTHGKTTTTVMTTLALAAEDSGVDPTGVVGGRVREWGGNLRHGDGTVFVVEADEYDRSFLALAPDIAVVTNVEADHLDIYDDLDDITRTFTEFAAKATCVIVCGDDPGSAQLHTAAGAKRVVYSANSSLAGADIAAQNITYGGGGSNFEVVTNRGITLGRVALRVPGVHNVRNALAAIAAGMELGVPMKALSAGLASFHGVDRRFDVLGEACGIAVVDDYAHHPTEIRATIAAARIVYGGRRLVCAFQPHLYSRTRDLASDFGSALAACDALFLTDIYPARESPIAGVSSALVASALLSHGGRLAWSGSVDELVEALLPVLRAGDVVVTLGAGSITRVAHQLILELRQQQEVE